MILDFGKFNGYDVANVDPKYLVWLERTRTDWLNEFRNAMRARGLPTSEVLDRAPEQATVDGVTVENLPTEDLSRLINELIAQMVKRQG